MAQATALVFLKSEDIFASVFQRGYYSASSHLVTIFISSKDNRGVVEEPKFETKNTQKKIRGKGQGPTF